MKEQSAFDTRHIADLAQIQSPGLLEHLRVPPATAAWMRRYQRHLWGALALVLALFVLWAIYDARRIARAEKALTALSAALLAPPEQRMDQLAEVGRNFASTDAAVWARIEQAHLALDKGDAATALNLFEQQRRATPSKSPLMPLLLYGVAVSQEKAGSHDAALESYRTLAEVKGFAPLSQLAMARLYELRGDGPGAVRMYEAFLAAGTDAASGRDSARDLAASRLRELKN